MELTVPNISPPSVAPGLALPPQDRRPRRGNPVLWLRVLEWTTLGLTLSALLMGLALAARFRLPPVVVDRLSTGQMIWRTTEPFAVSGPEMRAFLSEILTVLFSITPGSYDPGILQGRVGEGILETFAQQSAPGLQVGANQRRRYFYLDARRHIDPKIPGQLIFLVRGENVLLTFNPAAAEPFQRHEGDKWHLVYVDTAPVSPQNGYGLFVPYIEVVEDEGRARALWEQAQPLEWSAAPTDGTKEYQ
jgi:hypothetical protein